jgi:hemerythrin-like domain-containing protein
MKISVSREHQIILCGLEILRLMRERMESRHDVDLQDVAAILDFMREVAHRCLDNTERLLRPALSRPTSADQSAWIDSALCCHDQLRTLFAEMEGVASPGTIEAFLSASGSYTSELEKAIVQEGRLLPKIIHAVFDGEGDGSILNGFEETEREICDIARRHGPALHRLELKYAIPHCI